MKTTLSRLKDVIYEQIGTDQALVTEETKLADLGMDSLDEVELMMAVEEEWGITIDDDVASKWVTVADVVKTIDGRDE